MEYLKYVYYSDEISITCIIIPNTQYTCMNGKNTRVRTRQKMDAHPLRICASTEGLHIASLIDLA